MKQSVTTTFKQAIQANNIVISFLSSNTDETSAQFRLSKRTLGCFTKPIEDYNEQLDDKRIDLCVKGDKQQIIYADKDYTFTAEGQKLLKAAIKELQGKSVTFDITKVDYAMLTDREKKWFKADGEEIHALLGIFINDLPEFREAEYVPKTNGEVKHEELA